jgi:hypothetical protein
MAAFVYQRHEPENTVLYQCIQEHLPAFLAQAARADRDVPSFVLKELEAFLRCGRLEEGFARVKCRSCGFERLVAFSCKGRSGLCPSCGGRRMAETAAFIADHIWPQGVPARQWVLSLPHPLRYLLAYDSGLCGEVLRRFVGEIFAWQRRAAKAQLGLRRLTDAQPGAVCVLQRFGSAIDLNPHAHVLVTDGVFIADADRVVFRALPPPTEAEVAAVAQRTCERVVSLLRERGLWVDADPAEDLFAQQQPLLAACAAASITGRLAMGPNAGRRVMRLYGRAAREEHRKTPKNTYGFGVHASVRVPGRDRKRLERLAQYMTRPPLSSRRIERRADGLYQIELKRPWSDGTTHIVLSGTEVIEKLVALIPKPRMHMVRYYGVLAPRAKWRRLVVPSPPPEADGSDCAHQAKRLDWARLLKRVFAIDVLECPKCGSDMQRIAFITAPEAIQKILDHLERATGPP